MALGSTVSEDIMTPRHIPAALQVQAPASLESSITPANRPPVREMTRDNQLFRKTGRGPMISLSHPQNVVQSELSFPPARSKEGVGVETERSRRKDADHTAADLQHASALVSPPGHACAARSDS